MKFIMFVFFMPIIVTSCNDSRSSEANTLGVRKDSILAVSLDKELLSESVTMGDSVKKDVINEYLAELDSLYPSFGAIQNDKFRQYVFPMNSCNKKLQFEVIWVHKTKLFPVADLDSLTSIFKKERRIGYPSFDIIILDVPKTPVSQLKDEFDMGLITPSKARVYFRVDDKWSFDGEEKIKSFEDFTELEIKMVKKVSGS